MNRQKHSDIWMNPSHQRLGDASIVNRVASNSLPLSLQAKTLPLGHNFSAHQKKNLQFCPNLNQGKVQYPNAYKWHAHISRTPNFGLDNFEPIPLEIH